MHIEQRAFDFIDKTRRLRDPKAVFEGLQAESNALGFPHFMITGLPLPMEELAPLVMLNAWPEEWYARYIARNYFAIDGVAQWSLRTTQPFLWRDVPPDVSDTKAARDVMGEAAASGFVDGYVVPMYSARHWQSAVAFASSNVSDVSERELAALQIMGIFAAGAVRELIEPSELSSRKRLSPRERECLSWAAAGKSSWDISKILGISHHTARQYLSDIRRKLDVKTMAQAVAESIRRGEIRP
ncbi:MAG: LuxR family transcriptional regulator [Rhizobiaceae bacterium]|nr:LuxR family transcriptional regulator [Rhizobiaceae bacterium]